jgi:superfamily I DNA/RNA helicase
MDDSNRDELRKSCAARRSACTEKVIQSTSNKKIVVAGPGTGKTTLFGMLLKAKGGNSLTLSFINALVDDLAVGLYGLSEVRTLHGYAVGQLKKKMKETEIFPRLPDIIREDFQILRGVDANFKTLFQHGDGPKDLFDFYKIRKDYYGPYYGFADVIYAVVKFYEKNPGSIPKYDQIVVDEFQDFNKTEVQLVDQLATKSPILLAGDDDQALYISLKNASPEHIRQKHTDKKQGYEPHTLPFCSRSTEVIVEAINDLVKNALANGLLKERIEKPYLYFAEIGKDKESAAYPKIDYATVFEGQIAWFVQERMKELIEKERRKLDVLIVVPPQRKKFALPKIAMALREKGFKNVSFSDANDPKEPTFRDGLRLLIANKSDNLGWRVVAKVLMPIADFEQVLKEGETSSKPLPEILPKELIKQVQDIVKTVKKLRGDKASEVSDDMLKQILELLGHDSRVENIEWLEAQLDDDSSVNNHRGLRDAQITITTVPSSKGLAADYVFITHFDDAYYSQGGKGTVSDDNVFSFLVALTRARKKAYLISTQEGKEPALLGWIDKTRVNRL